jgi:hypothetical protein
MRAVSTLLLSLFLAWPAAALAAPCTAGAASSAYCRIGVGVQYRTVAAARGNDVFIGYGGYGVTEPSAVAWVDALTQARLIQLGVKHLYAVKGPADALYAAKEISNRALASHLLRAIGPSTRRIIVVAHSSGSFVANEILGWLASLSPATLFKIHYFSLDGGYGLSWAIAKNLARVYFVYAKMGAAFSRNAAVMKQQAGWFGAKALPVAVDASASGCRAADCLHDTVINTRPYSPVTFLVNRDYVEFDASHRVVTSYLDRLP